MDFHNILIATDGEELTEAAIRKSIELAELSGGIVTALYVLDKNASEADGSAAVAKVTAAGKKAGIKVIEKIEAGIPAEVIVSVAENFDIIVMGTAGRTGLKKFMVGSVAETVVKNAVCPVLVVRT